MVFPTPPTGSGSKHIEPRNTIERATHGGWGRAKTAFPTCYHACSLLEWEAQSPLDLTVDAIDGGEMNRVWRAGKKRAETVGSG